MTLSIRHATPRAWTLVAALGLSGLLGAGLSGCGGSSDGRGVPVPPGGVAIGNLVCINTSMVPPSVIVLQGEVRTITFNLLDVNLAVPGAGIPISFDVVGGTLSDPPTMTDGTATVTVIFTASTTYVGAARVRLISPELQLDCDASFAIYESALIVSARTTTMGGTAIFGYDACGDTETGVQYTDRRRVIFRARQVDPVTHAFVPAAGIFFHVSASPDLGLPEGEYGPTNGSGEFNILLPPFPHRLGEVVVTATAIRPDDLMDGIPDPDAGNTCWVAFLLETECDAHFDVLAVDYSDGSPMQPGESATITATVEIDGTPQAGYGVLVSTEPGGLINGSAVPVHLVTDGAGEVTVTYTALPGYSDGSATVTFQSDVGDINCVQTANVAVVTCDWDVEFATPPEDGGDHMVTLTLLNADSATAVGQLVALDVTGGFFTEQPPYFPLVDMGGGILQVSALLHVTDGFSGTAYISASFPGGYPCETVTKPFTVLP